MNEIGLGFIERGEARRKRRHRILLAIMPFAAAGAVAIGILQRRNGPPTETVSTETAPLVSTVAIDRRPFARWLAIEGTLVARHELAIGSETAGSRIEAVLADEGDRVVKGQVLLRLDTAVLQAQLRHAQAVVQDAAASAASTAADFQRADGIRGTGAVSVEQLDGRRAAARSAAARLLAAQAEVGELQARIAQAELRAPEDGVVVARDAEPGAITAAGGAPLFRLIEGGLVQCDAQVPQDALQGLASGLDAELRIGAPGQETLVRGRVRAIAPTLDPRSREGILHIDLPADPRLRPGAFVEGRILLSRSEALSVPRSAILSRDGTSSVYVVAGGQARRHAVEIGATEDGTVEIREGLASRDHVVLTAGAFLHDGQAVREAAPGAQASVMPDKPARSADSDTPAEPDRSANAGTQANSRTPTGPETPHESETAHRSETPHRSERAAATQTP
jgi:RND family efflux transporter MFP subunit